MFKIYYRIYTKIIFDFYQCLPLKSLPARHKTFAKFVVCISWSLQYLIHIAFHLQKRIKNQQFLKTIRLLTLNGMSVILVDV